MAAAGFDGWIVGREDMYQGEEVPAGDERLAYLSGFTGSAGFAVVLSDRAGLFSDGRYSLQMPAQTNSAAWDCNTIPDVTCEDWLKTAGRDGKPASLKDYHLKGVVLLGADLSNADLEGANLYGAYLKNANLENSNLQGANLRGANLRWANLKNADLKKANLTRADLMQAEIKNARLEGANLKMAEGLTSEQLAEAHTDSKTTL